MYYIKLFPLWHIGSPNWKKLSIPITGPPASFGDIFFTHFVPRTFWAKMLIVSLTAVSAET